jgi:hypothetical protein
MDQVLVFVFLFATYSIPGFAMGLVFNSVVVFSLAGSEIEA